MASNNPLEAAVDGYTALYNDGPDGLAVGGGSRRGADAVRSFAHGDPAVTNLRRARWIAREFHDWDIASEHDLHTRRMHGELSA